MNKSKYDRVVMSKEGVPVTIDVYRVLQAFDVKNPQLQHLIKKALACGLRGHKDQKQDLIDIKDSIDSAIKMHDQIAKLGKA